MNSAKESMNVRIVLTFILCLAASVATTAEPKRIHLANDDHTDYMWTADTETYHAAH